MLKTEYLWAESVEPQFQALRTGLARVVDPVLLQVLTLWNLETSKLKQNLVLVHTMWPSGANLEVLSDVMYCHFLCSLRKF